MKIFPPRISPFSCPKLVEDQKKRSSHKFSSVFGPKLGEGQKKVFTHRLWAQTFSQVTRGGGGMSQFCILFYANYTILATQRGGPWPNVPHPKYVPAYIQIYPANFKEKVVSLFLAADISLHKLNYPALKSLFVAMGKPLPSETAARVSVAYLASQNEQSIRELLQDKKVYLIVDEADVDK